MDHSENYAASASALRYLPLALIGVLVILFHSTFAGLLQRWTEWDESLSHGLIVNAVFVYLLARSLPWQAIRRGPLQKTFEVLALLVTSVAWFLFQLINISLLEQLSLLALLFALYAACYGVQRVFSQRLLLLLPVFSLPIWDGMTDTLVNLSSVVVGNLIRLIEMPAMIEGNSITIPSGVILIADGCSGIRYFQISLALAFMISLMNGYKEGRTLAILAVAALIGLATNWIRIFILVVVGYETEMQSSLMHDHEYFGWALFAAIMLPALYFAPVAKPAEATHLTDTNVARPLLLLPLLALSVGPLLSLGVSLDPKPLSFPPAFTSLALPAAPTDMPMPVTAPTGAQTQNATVRLPDGMLYAQVDRYQRKDAKDKLVPYFARLHNNRIWLNKKMPVAAGAPTLMRFTHKHNDRNVLQLQWFQVGSFTTQEVIEAKLLQIPTLISGQDGFSIYTVQTVCEEASCTGAAARLQKQVGSLVSSPPHLD